MKKNTNIGFALNKFKAYGLSIQAQHQCIGGSDKDKKIVHTGTDGLGQGYVGFGSSNTQAIIRSSSTGIETGIKYKRVSVTTNPFSPGPNASVQASCSLF